MRIIQGWILGIWGVQVILMQVVSNLRTIEKILAQMSVRVHVYLIVGGERPGEKTIKNPESQE